MKKYLPIFIIFLGLLVNLLVLVPQFYIHSWQTVIGLLLGVLGVNLAISNYKKTNITWKKNCLILGGVINVTPVLYFIFLFFAIG